VGAVAQFRVSKDDRMARIVVQGSMQLLGWCSCERRVSHSILEQSRLLGKELQIHRKKWVVLQELTHSAFLSVDEARVVLVAVESKVKDG
jgi:hypothetical protein